MHTLALPTPRSHFPSYPLLRPLSSSPFAANSNFQFLFICSTHSSLSPINSQPLSSHQLTISTCCSIADPTSVEDSDNVDVDSYFFTCQGSNGETSGGISIEVQKVGTNSRRIRSKIAIEASLDAVWSILTDYERLADFIPGLAVSKLLEKKDNFARLYQIGQQNLPLGLKFNAKAVLDCYEKDLETLYLGKKRDIEFKMTEGDFQFFQGKWSIEQVGKDSCEDQDLETTVTTLSYSVDIKPKLWLPVHLIEGRICSEIKMNLTCIREEAQNDSRNSSFLSNITNKDTGTIFIVLSSYAEM
ncbi:hypothetical protein LINPERHAP1_LOCUS8350 [Linum perenne]